MLIDLAELLKQSSDSKDILCRIGGDEFLAFYTDTTHEQMKEKTRFINEEILKRAKKHMGDDMSIPLGVSVGAVTVPAGEDTEYEVLFRKADRALYSVKNSGKHDCRLYEEIVANVDSDDANITGITELRAILGERGKSDKPYRVERERMQDIYRLLVRFGDNDVVNSSLVHFTITGNGEEQVTPEIMELFLNTLKENLRNVDVYGNDSGNRVIVLLTDVDLNTAVKIADRIINKWNTQPKSEGYEITYEKEIL
jgi:energy-coupling factor transport system substrate-specific component